MVLTKPQAHEMQCVTSVQGESQARVYSKSAETTPAAWALLLALQVTVTGNQTEHHTALTAGMEVKRISGCFSAMWGLLLIHSVVL